MRTAPVACALAVLIPWFVSPASSAENEPLSATKAPAPAARPVMTLADIGGAPIRLAGSNPAATVAFPLPAYGITGGDLALQVQPSPSLLGTSQVRVFVEDALAGVTSVAALRVSPAWSIRVGAARGPWLHVRFEGAFSIDHPAPCDQQAGAVWLQVEGSSTLRYDAAPGVPSIAEFLRFPGGRLVLDADWSTPAGQADAIAVYAALRRAIADTPIDLVVGGVAPPDETAARPSRHVIVAPAGSSIRREATSLFIGADQSTLDLVAAAGARSALLGRLVSGKAVTRDGDVPTRCGATRLCLSDLGLREQSVSGTGALTTSFNFTIADIGGWPGTLAFDLDTAFDAIPTTTLERAVLRVRFNGALVDTADIRGQSSLRRTITLPIALAEVANRVDVEFFYAPVTGNCEGSPFTFSGQLRRTSAVTWGGSGRSHGVLGEVIASRDRGVSLELAGATAALARTAARILGEVNLYHAQPLAMQANGAALHFVIGRALPQSVPTRLSLGQSLEVRSASTGRTLLHATPDQPLVSLEYQADRGLLVLQSSPGADDALEGGAFETQFALGRWLGAAGNAFVSNGDETVTLDLGSPALVVEAETPVTPWWVVPRPAIFGAGAIVVLLLLLLIYRRLGRRPPIPVRPAGR